MRILTLSCLAQVLCAQGGIDPWSALRSSNPTGLSIELRLNNPHAFHQGELISAELNLPTFVPGGASPASEQWQFAGILLDPAVNCGTVARPCFAAEPAGCNGIVPASFAVRGQTSE